MIDNHKRREHAGGSQPRGMVGSQPHGVCGFDYSALDGPPPEDVRSVEEFTEALGELLRWLIHYAPVWEDGRNKPHGVYVRVMTLLYMVAPESIGVESQKELAKRLGVSRAWVNEIVQDFVGRFGYAALHLRLASKTHARRAKARKR